MTEQVLADRETIAANIVKFTQDNGLRIHPGQEPLKWADLVIKNGGCPCVPGRSECPCEFVLEDIKELGRCRCGLFCNAAYLREYNRLIGDRKSSRQWKRKQGRSSF
ncbi:hypothetical protein ES705_31656 [subsurface metagenome]